VSSEYFHPDIHNCIGVKAFENTPVPEETKQLPSPPTTPVHKGSVKPEDIFQLKCEPPSDSESLLSCFSLDKVTLGSGTVESKRPLKIKGKNESLRKKPYKRVSNDTAESEGDDVYPLTKKREKTEHLYVRHKLLSTRKPGKHLQVTIPLKELTKDIVSSDYHSSEDISRGPSPIPPSHLKPKLKKTKSRTTNNSLSAALNPSLHRPKLVRKKRSQITNVGKLCAAYYPSSRKLVPHKPGERYYKGKPYSFYDIINNRGKCAREDCIGDSKATVTRHCISEYLQKGARGSSIPRHLRLFWCNKCYMRFFFLMQEIIIDIERMWIIILVYSV
jgi:hypothetical protein